MYMFYAYIVLSLKTSPILYIYNLVGYAVIHIF